MKKKMLFIILLLSLTLTLVGCGSSSEEDSGKKVKGGETSEKTNSKGLSEASIEETVLFDKNDIKVTAKEIEYGGSWDVVNIKLLIENNSDQNITISDNSFSINGLMIEPYFSADVASGKKANAEISIDEDDLEVAKITTIKDIEMDLLVYDSDTWDDIFEEKDIKLSTNAKNYEQEYNTDGYLAYNKNDVKIYVLKLDDEDSFWGADLYVYVENNTKKDIVVQAKDVSINGFMVDPSFSVDVDAGKKAYDTMTFFESDLEENDIEDITELELKFYSYDIDTWDDLFSTDAIKIELE